MANFHTVRTTKKLEIVLSVNSKKLLKIQRNLLNFGKPKTENNNNNKLNLKKLKKFTDSDATE